MMRLTPTCCMALCLLPASVYAVPANSVTDIHWDKDNTVRVGESINTVYRIAMADGSSNHLWLNVDCGTQAKTLLYMNLRLPGGKKSVLTVVILLPVISPASLLNPMQTAR